MALSLQALPRRQKVTHEEVTRLQPAQHLGDEADQYTDSLLSHFKSGGACNTYSSMIRRFTDTGSSVNIRITKIHKIMDNTHKYNSRSKQELSDLTFKKPVAIQLVDIDRYHRIVGRIYVNDLDVSAEMVRLGAAWVYLKYAEDQNLYKLEDGGKVS